MLKLFYYLIIMKFTFSHLPTWYLSWLLLLSTTLCSFSSVPVADVREDNPPIERKAESKRQKRLQKRYNRLYKRFDQAKNSQKRLQLQKKIRNLERQQEDTVIPAWAIIGMILGLIAALLFFISFFSLFYSLIKWVSALNVAAPFLVGGLGTGVIGLTFSIIATLLVKKNPEKYSGRAMAITGIITSSVALGLILILGFLLIYFSR